MDWLQLVVQLPRRAQVLGLRHMYRTLSVADRWMASRHSKSSVLAPKPFTI